MFCFYLSEKTVLMCHFVRKNTKNNCISTFFYKKMHTKQAFSSYFALFFFHTRWSSGEKQQDKGVHGVEGVWQRA
jgi:hypothetical protein